MRAIVIGYGGIGKNVYVPQLERLGYKVYVVDPVADGATYPTVNDVPKNLKFDVAVVCCPNAHHLNAVLELTDVCKNILVEKPGLANTAAWNRTVHRFPEHNIVMVKNNLYRHDISKYAALTDSLNEMSKIEINWMNADRIPNPGGWFTNEEMAFGGVTHDLFPHLYCFMFAMIPFNLYHGQIGKTFKMQRWNLDTISDNTDYGTINRGGVYDVCDYAEQHFMIPRDGNEPLPVTLRASWKEGYDDQGVYVHYKDAGKVGLHFGLCPDYAYGEMIKALMEDRFMEYERQTWIEHDFDQWIHAQLEAFNSEN